MALQRLQKILAEAGVASRRKCEEIIAQGRVTVDGIIVKMMGVKADPENARIEVDGVPVRAQSKAYYLLNKPSGILSTTMDEFGRPTVMGLIPGEDRRLYPVGRLDEDTEGLILLTNDGELANIMTHPRYGVPKTYSARLRGVITTSAVDRLLGGVRLEDGFAKADEVRVTYRGDTESYVRLVMREGRNHIVRRMLAKIGFPAKRLRRDRIAFLTMHDLQKGGCRPLTRLEVAKLYNYAEPAAKEAAAETAPPTPPRPKISAAPRPAAKPPRRDFPVFPPRERRPAGAPRREYAGRRERPRREDSRYFPRGQERRPAGAGRREGAPRREYAGRREQPRREDSRYFPRGQERRPAGAGRHEGAPRREYAGRRERPQREDSRYFPRGQERRPAGAGRHEGAPRREYAGRREQPRREDSRYFPHRQERPPRRDFPAFPPKGGRPERADREDTKRVPRKPHRPARKAFPMTPSKADWKEHTRQPGGRGFPRKRHGR